ncbi:tRNA (adenosine(37)-N6)-dimethylallyltransferase MiaA [Nitrosomonas sp.]|uniref:tRNA (adenosine(37)-N6)-dimethylallyltransferase MiaA n=1 Tax=Nitrosomonas sp. TaxID=42353 RepID=UPI0025CE517D|nr:tRNA (adenosine(37)-N6)-dimethylallyltransferase MiaA [Nitrosomonas sp.]
MQNPICLPTAIFLMGPTASGKSQIALDIAKELPIEIISVDSAQVYRYMNIGTAKPEQEILTHTPHHLINLIDPDQTYSAAQFRKDALNIMQDISSRNKIPLLVGGTMLYFRVLQDGLSVLPAADQDMRLQLEHLAKKLGWPAMHQKLSELDPTIAARIKPTDSQRIQRALEVCYLTQQPMSEILKTSQPADFPYRKVSIALIPSERSQLHSRITERFGNMLNAGLIDEVQSIRQRFSSLNMESPSMRCVGYRQVCLYLDNKISRDEMHDMGIAATRQLAKRQLTWLRGIRVSNEIYELDCLSSDSSTRVHNLIRAVIETCAD